MKCEICGGYADRQVKLVGYTICISRDICFECVKKFRKTSDDSVKLFYKRFNELKKENDSMKEEK